MRGSILSSLPLDTENNLESLLFKRTKKLSNPDISMFTDRSKIDGDTGADVFLGDLNLYTEKPIGKHITVFQAKVVGTMQTATEVLGRNIVNKNIQR